MKNRTGKKAAVFFILIATLIFGFNPVLTKSTYAMGSNGPTSTFLRAVLALPVLVLIIKMRGGRLVPQKQEILPVFMNTGLSSGITMVLLSVSYAYVPVGVATVLHYVYPIVTAVAGRVLFGRRLGRTKLLALVFCTAGVFCFLDRTGSVDYRGIAIALLSGVTYSWHLMSLERGPVVEMDLFRASLYQAVMVGFVSSTYGLLSGQLHFDMPVRVYANMFAVAFLTMVVALPLLKEGVGTLGGLTGAILSTFEPLGGLFFGALFLGEHLSAGKLLGCAAILTSVVMTAKGEAKNAEGEQP